MKTSEIISELETHLATHFMQRDPRKSDQLMGYAMLQLKEARRVVAELTAPPHFDDVVARADREDVMRAVREFVG